MTISLLCVTNNEHADVKHFVLHMRSLANIIRAEFVLGLDREKAQQSELGRFADRVINLKADKLQEDVLDQAISQCSGEWALRLDDDEQVSNSLAAWLRGGTYVRGSLYAFPRVYLYPDRAHFVTNDFMYPDLQTRLGKKELMLGCNYVHAGNPNGTGWIVPYAIEHHNLLVKSLDERRAIAARYESLRPGAGTKPEYIRYNLPEDFYPEFKLKDYTNGDFSITRN